MRWKILLVVFALAGVLLGAGSSTGRAEVDSQSVTSEGLSVYFGFVPAAVAQGIAQTHGDTNQRGTPPAGDHAYHLIVAIFNSVTGDRITDAAVTASVTRPGFAPPAKPLEPMKIADTISYGNFFDLPSDGDYRIRLSITRKDKPRPAVIDLTYDHHLHEHQAR
jgi:hypothetical protein